MSIKVKARRRLVLLLSVVLIVCIAGGGFYVFRKMQIRAEYARMKEDGLAASAAGEHEAAVETLRTYLWRHPTDLDALVAFAESRPHTKPAGPERVRETMNVLRNILLHDPERLEERRELMRLYTLTGHVTETMDSANLVLEQEPDDAEALSLKTSSLVRLNRGQEALAVAERWAEVAPGDVEAHLMVMALRQEGGRPNEELMDYARRLRAEYPDDPKFDLVLGVAYGLTGDFGAAATTLRAAAQASPPDDSYTRVLINQLDRMGMFEESLGVLREAVDGSSDQRMHTALVRRLWEQQRIDEMIELVERMALKDEQVHRDVIGLYALALSTEARHAEADAAQRLLRQREDEPGAQAWADVLELVLSREPVGVKQLLDTTRSAIERDGTNLNLRYIAADAHARMGEIELAVQAMEEITRTNLTWPLPPMRLAELHLSRGRSDLALQAVAEAVRRGRGFPPALITLARVMSARPEASDSTTADELLRLIDDIQRHLPGERHTLVAKVEVLSRSDRKPEAAELIQLLLQHDLDQGMLLRLASVSRTHGLGLEDECLALAAQRQGMTPELAYARAVERLLAGEAEAGLRLIDESRAAAEGQATPTAGQKLEWEVARVRYLEVMQHPDAAGAWVRLGDAYPGNLQVQQMIIAAPSVQRDRAFVERTIQRLREQTGEQALGWRMAQARWLLQPQTNEGVAEAAQLLNDVIRVQPDVPEPRVLLANCMERMGNITGAIDQLTIAANMNPTSAQIALNLARLHQGRGDFDRAREHLDRVAGLGGSAPDDTRSAALLLAMQGEIERAITMLEPLEDQSKPSLLMATLYRHRGQTARAEAMVQQLLADPDPSVIQFAADLYAAQGKMEQAQEALAKLDGLELPSGVKELVLADFYGRHGTPEESISHYHAATEAAPQNAAAWRALIAMLIADGRVEPMRAAIEAAVKGVPRDAEIQQIRQHGELLAQASAHAALRQIAMTFARAPQAPGAAETLRAAVEIAGRDTMSEADVTRLRQLADRHPRYLPLQTLLIHVHGASGRLDEAASVASRAVQTFPGAVEPPRMAAEIFAARGSWSEALGFARAWRDRAGSNPMPADVFIAEVQLQLNQPDAAMQQLHPYIDQAPADPDRHARVILAHARGLYALGQHAQLNRLIEPLWARSPQWRQIAMSFALEVMSPAHAAEWFAGIERLIAEDAMSERVLLAEMWGQLARRSGSEEHAEQSRRMLIELSERPDTTPEALVALAIRHEMDTKPELAEPIYRRALEMQANPIAQNNLAMILANRGGDLTEAAALASAAIAAHPNVPAFHDTLAFVLSRTGDFDGAIRAMRQAVALEAANPKWQVHLAEVLLDGGQVEEVGKVLTDIEALPNAVDLPAELRSRLQALRQRLETLEARVE